MDPYNVNMMSGTFVVTYMSQLHATMIAHTQDPYSEFHIPIVCAYRLLWSLPTINPRVEFRIQYHDFMTIRALGCNKPRFQLQEVWATIASELMLKDEFA